MEIIFLILFYYIIIKVIIKIIRKNKENKDNKKFNNAYSNYIKRKAIQETEKTKQEKINKEINLLEKINYNNNITSKYKTYYKPKRYITTLNELKFYNVLLEIAKELDLILFAQVSLYSILEVKENLNKSIETSYFNKIKAKSIDFVLVDKKNCRIKLCIELDDNTHKKNNRKQRDNFINELFEELEIPLLRYPTYTIYYKEPLKLKILQNIKNTYYN